MPSTGYVPTRERMDGASCSATVTRMPEGKGRPPGTRRIPAASRSKWSPRPPLRDHLPKGDGGGEDDRAETRQGRTTGQKLGTTGRRCGNSAGPGSRSRLELGERSVAKQQPLSPVRRLEGHLDLRLLALSRDLADRPHSEGIMRDPVADGQLRHLRSRDRFAPRPEAGTVDVLSATAQPSAEGGPAPAAVPCPEGASPTVAAGGGEAGTAESGPCPRHVQHGLRDLVEEPAGRHELGGAPHRPHLSPGDVELLPGTGDADVSEPALLLQLLGVAERAVVREGAVLQRSEERRVGKECRGGGGGWRYQEQSSNVVLRECSTRS